MGYRYGQTYRSTSDRIFSPCATNTGRRMVSTSTRIRSHFPRDRLQIRVDIPQDLRWQTELLMILADKSLNKYKLSARIRSQWATGTSTRIHSHCQLIAHNSLIFMSGSVPNRYRADRYRATLYRFGTGRLCTHPACPVLKVLTLSRNHTKYARCQNSDENHTSTKDVLSYTGN